MLRVALSLVSLLVVLLIVMKLAGQQLKPVAAESPPRGAAEAGALQVRNALEQAAAARASEASSQ